MNAISSSITHNIKRQHDDEHIDIDIKTTNHLKNIMYPGTPKRFQQQNVKKIL